MRLPAPVLIIAAIVAALPFSVGMMSGCGSGTVKKPLSTGTADSSSVKKGEGVTVTLGCEPRVAKPGEPFALTLNVRNTSGDSRTFTLPTSQQYDFIATSAGGKVVWRWSSGMMFAQVVTPLKMAAEESLEYKAAWHPSGQAAGKYTIEGFFLGMEDLRPAVSVEVSP